MPQARHRPRRRRQCPNCACRPVTSGENAAVPTVHSLSKGARPYRKRSRIRGRVPSPASKSQPYPSYEANPQLSANHHPIPAWLRDFEPSCLIRLEKQLLQAEYEEHLTAALRSMRHACNHGMTEACTFRSALLLDHINAHSGAFDRDGRQAEACADMIRACQLGDEEYGCGGCRFSESECALGGGTDCAHLAPLLRKPQRVVARAEREPRCIDGSVVVVLNLDGRTPLEPSLDSPLFRRKTRGDRFVVR